MNNFEEMVEYLDKEEMTKVKEFLAKLRRQWYWFIILGFLGLALGYLASELTQPIYRMETTLLVKEDSKGIIGENFFSPRDFKQGQSNIQNNMGMLKSYNLNRKVMNNLNWRVSWYQPGLISNKDLYGKEPFLVNESKGAKNYGGVPLTIYILTDQRFRVAGDGTIMIEGEEHDIEFEKEGRFGVPFKAGDFGFTLNKIEGVKVEKNAKYYLEFNDLDEMTVKLQKKLKVMLADEESDLIRIQLEESKRVRGVNYLNELSRIFIQYGLQEKNRISENTVRFIDVQLRGVVDSLQLADRTFTNYRSRNRIVNLGQEAGLVVTKLEQLESEKSMAEMRLQYFKNLNDYMGDATQMSKMVAPSLVGITDPGLNALVVKLSDLYSRREVLAFSVKEKNPTLVILNREIHLTIKGLGDNLKSLLQAAQLEVNALNDRLKKANSELTRLPKTEQELISIKRKFDLNSELYTYLLKKRAEAAITKACNVPDSRVVDPALVETAVLVWPKTGINLLVGFLLGISFAFLLILFRDYFNDRIQSLEEVEKASKIPLVGTISHNHYREHIPVTEHPRSGISESFRSLRTNLHYLLMGNKQKVIAVHSFIPKEGKSFTSVNLASILAMNNKKVLLVGADLRKPNLYKVFDVENKTGLSTFLIKHNSFEEVVQATNVKNLSFVPSGPVPPNPAELLGNGQYEEFINKARENFDYVVIDNAPVSLVTDSLLTGRYADANLFMLRQSYSQKHQIKYINKLADQGSIRKVALVLNDVKNGAYGYRYRYNSRGYYEEDKSSKRWNRFWSSFRSN